MLDPIQLMDFVKFNLINKYMQNVESSIFIPIIIMFFLYNIFMLQLPYHLRNKIILKIKYYNFFKPLYTLCLKGNIIQKHSTWSSRTSSLFSDNFRAMWNRINELDSVIYSTKECVNLDEDADKYDEEFDTDNVNSETNIKNKSLFIVDQVDSFYIENDIYGKVEYLEDGSDDENKKQIRVERITLTLFSFKKNVHEIEKYVENVCENYLQRLKEKRNKKRFIYSLKEVDSKENILTWHEQEFTTNKNFNNMFFKNKEDILRQIDFFVNNKDWYKNEGNPYCLGVGLSGLPGTGKTSFMKALAKYLDRHIIVIPLNKVKTENDFFDAYFDEKYNQNNSEKITFKDKIIVFEDIDCMSDIVLKRQEKNKKKENNETVFSKDMLNGKLNELSDTNNDNDSNYNSDTNVSYKKNNLENIVLDKTGNINLLKKTDDFTLSFLLNTLDGIFETDGRVLVITSNHYNKLYPALIRPGRIDISIKMDKLTFDIIDQIYKKNFNSNIPKKYAKQLKNIKVTPCELINLQKYENINKDEFIEKLLILKDDN